MKKIQYFKRGDEIPDGAKYLCFTKVLAKTICDDSTGYVVKYEYEDVFVYEVEEK